MKEFNILLIFLISLGTIKNNTNIHSDYKYDDNFENIIKKIQIENERINETNIDYQNYLCEFRTVKTNYPYIKIKGIHNQMDISISISITNHEPKSTSSENIFTKRSNDTSLIYLPLAAFDTSDSESNKTFYMGIECVSSKNCNYTIDFEYEDMIELTKESTYMFNTTNNYLVNEAKIMRSNNKNEIFNLFVSGGQYENVWITLEYVYMNESKNHSLSFSIIPNNFKILNYTKIAYIDENDYPYLENAYYHLIINTVIPSQLNITINTIKNENYLDMGNFDKIYFYFLKGDSNISFNYNNRISGNKYYYHIKFENNSGNLNVYLQKNNDLTMKKIAKVDKNSQILEISNSNLNDYNKIFIDSSNGSDIIFSMQIIDYHSKGNNVMIIVGICLGVFIIFIVIFVIYLKKKKIKNDTLGENSFEKITDKLN